MCTPIIKWIRFNWAIGEIGGALTRVNTVIEKKKKKKKKEKEKKLPEADSSVAVEVLLKRTQLADHKNKLKLLDC